MTRPLPALLSALLAAFALAASAAGYKSMWITDVASGRTVGPVVNKPGNRFSAGGREWIVLQSKSGEVNFADAASLAPQGPYGLVEQRMFELGSDAYVFTRVLDYEGNTPGANEAVVSQAERAPAEKGRHPWSADLPERWILAPLPSTNPGDHKAPGKSWHLETLQVAPTATVWAEPVHEDPYDWTLGGFSGTDASVETRRLGLSGSWKGLFAEAAFVAGGKSSGSLVPDGTSLSSLKLDDVDGWHLAAGYRYAFVIDGPWSASASVFGSWDSLSAGLSATTTAETDISVETVEVNDKGETVTTETVKKGIGFSEWKDDATLEELRAGVSVGLQYDEWYWGASLRVLADCWNDTSLDVKIPVAGETYRLEADRARPVGVQASAWYCPAGNWILEGSLVLGSETTLRLGAGFFF